MISLYRTINIVCLCLIFLVAGTAVQAAESSKNASVRTVIGPLLPQPVATLYVVVPDDQPVQARLVINRCYRPEADRILVRAFDPQENLTFWQYSEPGNVKDTLGPGDMEIWGIPLQIPNKPADGDLLLDNQITLKGKGVHQIRIVAGARNSAVTVELSRPLGWGVSFQNGNYSPFGVPQTLTSLYAFVPPHAEELTVLGGPVTVTDETGKALSSVEDIKSQKAVTIPVTRTSVLWKFDFPAKTSWKFRAAGFPLILCPTPEAAQAIQASVITLPDGTVVCHEFQRKIAEILPTLLTPERVGKTEELVVPLAQYREQWLADPMRNDYLLGKYGPFLSIETALKNQNLDPSSHWSGAFGGEISDWVKKADGGEGGWQIRAKKTAPENRWDRLKSVNGLWAGVSPRRSEQENLAQAVFINAPFNPYYGKKELLYRAAAGALKDLMALGEDENWRGVGADMTDYAGMMAFSVAQKTFPVFELVAPHMPPEVRAVWSEGLRHIVDRMYTEQLVTCRNQSSHFLVAFEAYAKGSGDPRYLELSRAYARRFAAGTHPAGFQIEQCGPDGSYIGMTNWHMAVYYRQSKDPVILETIRRGYRFFNHTVAPEPGDRGVLGGFNFNHRIGDGFYNEQWSGAKGILDDVLPEVGLWARSQSVPDQKEKTVNDAVKQINASLDQPAKMEGGNLTTPRYLYAAKPNLTGTWPAQEKGSYIRNLSGELIAVKRPGYYTAVYVGKPAPHNHYISPRENYRLPEASDPDNNGGEVSTRKVTPYLGGGLSFFWTPDYGSSLLSTNWSAQSRHGLVAWQADGKRYWEDYFASQYKLDEKAGVLTITGKIEGQPIQYERTYQFGDQELSVSVKLTASKAVSLKRMAEILPVAVGARKINGAEIVIAGEKNNTAQSDRIVIQDKQGKGVVVQFEQPQNLLVQRNGMKRYALQLSRVEVALPENWQAGQTILLKYKIRPL